MCLNGIAPQDYTHLMLMVVIPVWTIGIADQELMFARQSSLSFAPVNTTAGWTIELMRSIQSVAKLRFETKTVNLL